MPKCKMCGEVVGAHEIDENGFCEKCSKEQQRSLNNNENLYDESNFKCKTSSLKTLGIFLILLGLLMAYPLYFEILRLPSIDEIMVSILGHRDVGWSISWAASSPTGILSLLTGIGFLIPLSCKCVKN